MQHLNWISFARLYHRYVLHLKQLWISLSCLWIDLVLFFQYLDRSCPTSQGRLPNEMFNSSIPTELDFSPQIVSTVQRFPLNLSSDSSTDDEREGSSNDVVSNHSYFQRDRHFPISHVIYFQMSPIPMRRRIDFNGLDKEGDNVGRCTSRTRTEKVRRYIFLIDDWWYHKDRWITIENSVFDRNCTVLNENLISLSFLVANRFSRMVLVPKEETNRIRPNSCDTLLIIWPNPRFTTTHSANCVVGWKTWPKMVI